MAKRFLLALLSILVAVGFSEMAVRVMEKMQRGDDYQVPYKYNCFVKGEYYWIGFKPNSNCWFTSNNQELHKTQININSQGLRNREVVMPKPAGVKRVVFVGDSFTVGWGVADTEAYPQVVEKLMRDKGVNFESVNAGLTAAGPAYYYLYLKNEGLKLDPDVVVVGLYYWNDIAYDAQRIWVGSDENNLPEKVYAKHYYVTKDGGLGFELDGTLPSQRFLPMWVRKSRLAAWMYNNVLWKGTGMAASDYSIKYGLCLFKKDCLLIDQEKESVNRILTGIKKITDEKGIKLMVALLPIEFQVNPDVAAGKYKVTVLPWEVDYPNRQLVDFFEAQNMSYVDLLPEFQADTKGSKYYTIDDHWNGYGHRLAAEIISNKLMEYGD